MANTKTQHLASDLMDAIIKVVERFELKHPEIETIHYDFNITELTFNKRYDNNTNRRAKKHK